MTGEINTLHSYTITADKCASFTTQNILPLQLPPCPSFIFRYQISRLIHTAFSFGFQFELLHLAGGYLRVVKVKG